MSLPAPARIASPAWVRHGGKPGVGTGSAGGVAPAGGDLEARGVAATDGIAETDGAAESGGELEALARLEAFLARLSGYGMDRDRLDRDASSRLSTALHLGTLSPTVLVERIAARGGPGADRFLAEVAWRDFYAHRLAAEAGGAEIEPDPITWRDDPVAFEAWATGRTGYPAVDAGMRQLAATGWLPNRARMIAASFLVKDLLIDWRRGARHFMRHLEDGDMASNTGNWRWVAGVGPGSAPWFRIFDPIAQGRRHDPGAHWIRRWLPELADQSDALVHEPWLATPPPSGYPARIVDHAQARRRALAAASARRQG
jgi:deoxyribodipyrimidine photo-lyase